MNILDTTTILAILSAILLSLLIYTILKNTRTIKKLQHKLDSQADFLQKLNSHFNVVCGAARYLGDDVAGIEKNVRRIIERQNSLDMREPEVASYKQAIILAKEGAKVDDLMNTFGLGQTEAELLHLMHQKSH